MCHDRRYVTGWLLLALLLLGAISPAGATTLEQLQRDGRLHLRTWITPASSVVARQQVQLHIEIATDRWFSAGTRIGHMDVRDAIVLQRETFAVNSTRRQGAQTWAIQQWTLMIYPQREGRFDVPAVAVHLSVAGDDGAAAVEGTVYTAPLMFTAALPAALQDVDAPWLVTREFKVTEQYNRSFDGLDAGDALVRTIRIHAVDVPAMMLPVITPETADGLAVYEKPAQLVDRSDRGNARAERTQTFTYVFEKPGIYHLSARTFLWWNPASRTLESVQLAVQTLHVGGSVIGKAAGISWRNVMAGVILLSVLFGFGWYLWHTGARRRVLQRSQPPSERELRQRFARACRRHDAAEALRLLYQWLDHRADVPLHASVRQSLQEAGHQQLLEDFDALMQSLYGNRAQLSVDLDIFAKQWLQLYQQRHRFASDAWKVRLSLN